jgi:hypothetical protein
VPVNILPHLQRSQPPNTTSERYNGIVEVNGSIPFGSTNRIKGLARNG